MSLLSVAQSLENTPLSSWLRDQPFPFPVLLTIHVLTIGLCGAVIGLVDLRILGKVLPNVPVSQLLNQFRLWKWLGFASMLITGIILSLSDPVEYHDNIMYWFSLIVLILVGVNALVFHYGAYQTVNEWDEAPVAPASARRFAFLSLLGWISLILISRAIAFF